MYSACRYHACIQTCELLDTKATVMSYQGSTVMSEFGMLSGQIAASPELNLIERETIALVETAHYFHQQFS